MRFPLSAKELELQCPLCLQGFSKASNKTKHLATHHTVHKPYLGSHFRQVQSKGKGPRAIRYNCIMCGYSSTKVVRVIRHMRDMHTKLQRVRFNVDWIVVAYRSGPKEQVVCNGGKGAVSLDEIGEHSA